MSELIIWCVASLDCLLHQLQPQLRHVNIGGLITATFEVVKKSATGNKTAKENKMAKICTFIVPTTNMLFVTPGNKGDIRTGSFRIMILPEGRERVDVTNFRPPELSNGAY